MNTSLATNPLEVLAALAQVKGPVGEAIRSAPPETIVDVLHAITPVPPAPESEVTVKVAPTAALPLEERVATALAQRDSRTAQVSDLMRALGTDRNTVRKGLGLLLVHKRVKHVGKGFKARWVLTA